MANDVSLNKEKILDVAEQVFRRYGSNKTSVVDVARVLEVSHGTIYRYFPSKASLREQVTKRWLSNISHEVNTISAGFVGNAKDRLRLWFKTLFQKKLAYATKDPELFTMFTEVTLEGTQMISEHVEHLIVQVTRIIEEGISTGEIKTGSPEELAKALFLATSRFHHPAHSYEWSTPTIEHEFDLVWNLLLSGLLNTK